MISKLHFNNKNYGTRIILLNDLVITLIFCSDKSKRTKQTRVITAHVIMNLWRSIKGYFQLTATVEPFLPTPPVNITISIFWSDHRPHTKVSIGIIYHKVKVSLKNWSKYLVLITKKNNNNNGTVRVDDTTFSQIRIHTVFITSVVDLLLMC